ncbi:MAG: hypothetical protein KDK36_06035, partial [Leptospiraceae bacterium]|nr:hypothetical protein [Leptospiraceae bacterium]
GLSMTTYSKTNCLPEQSRRVTDTVELNSNRSWFDSAHHTDSSNNDNLNFNLGLIPENWTITLKSWGTFLLLGERCFALPTCYL